MLVGGAVATALTGVLVGWSVMDHDEPPRFCAGTGVITETTGATPREGLDAFVLTAGGNPDDWSKDGDFGDHGYHRNVTDAVPQGTAEFIVEETSPGTWQVTGSCAG